MKKKLVKVANQIIDLETKLQVGENMQENLEKLEKLVSSLSENNMYEIDEYLLTKGIRIDK